METYDSASRALCGIYKNLSSNGVKTSPRGIETVEIEDYSFRLSDPDTGICLSKERGLNYSLIALEFLSYVSGVGGTTEHAELTRIIAPNFAAFIDDTTRVLNGAYGPRIDRQLDYVIKLLREDPDSRQAQVIIARPQELNRVLSPAHKGEKNDFPCTQIFTFRIRQGKLNMSTVMRSNDMYWGTPYDIAAFTMIQRLMAKLLDISVGTYTHYAASMHYYSSVIDNIKKAHHYEKWTSLKATPLSFDYANMEDVRRVFSEMIADRLVIERFTGCSEKVRREGMQEYEDKYSNRQSDMGFWLMLTKRFITK